MISTQVRHHTHLDLSTFRVCFVKHMMIMRQYFPRLCYDPYPLMACAWSRPLSSFRALVCDLLPRRLFHAFAKGALSEEYLTHNFDEHCLGGHTAYLVPFLP